VSAPVRERR